MYPKHLTTIYFVTYEHLNIPYLAQHISFSSFMPITFEIVHTSVSLQNTNGHEVLSDNHKYFTFISHIFSSTSMIS